MLTYTIHVLAQMELIVYLLRQSIMGGNVAKWTIMLFEFDLCYIPQKSKHRVVSEFLVELLIESTAKIPRFSQ